jgi:hypothetical protein
VDVAALSVVTQFFSSHRYCDVCVEALHSLALPKGKRRAGVMSGHQVAQSPFEIILFLKKLVISRNINNRLKEVARTGQSGITKCTVLTSFVFNGKLVRDLLVRRYIIVLAAEKFIPKTINIRTELYLHRITKHAPKNQIMQINLQRNNKLQ